VGSEKAKQKRRQSQGGGAGDEDGVKEAEVEEVARHNGDAKQAAPEVSSAESKDKDKPKPKPKPKPKSKVVSKMIEDRQTAWR